MEKYTIETSGKKITNLSAEDVVKHYQNKVTTELIGSLASTEYPETFADAEEVAQDFGDTVTKVEPTKDNAAEGGKAEFADGDESAQNFNGCPDCDKMLSKASKKEGFVAITDENRYCNNFGRFAKLETNTFYTDLEKLVNEGKVKIFDTYEEAKKACQGISKTEFGEVLSLEDLWEPETSAEKEEVVVIDLDGKVLSWVDDEHVDFLDTVDEPDGGKAKAVKFEDEADVRETMETVGYSDEEYEILPVSKAFAFVEEGED